MDALLWEVLSVGSPDDVVEVLIRLSDVNKVPDRIKMVARIGNIVSCRIQRADIEIVRSDANVVSMKATRTVSLDPPIYENKLMSSFPAEDAPWTSRRPQTQLTGQGVAIGLADWGLDFSHPNFLDDFGNSRFIALWDQGASFDGVNRYGYGCIHYRDEINDSLRSGFPFQSLGYHPGKTDIFHQGMHGTHVLDIAAGSGRVGNIGIAPGADLIGVHLATEKFKDLMGLGESSRVFDALHFLDEMAGEQPLVINLSVGSHGDAHRGLSLLEQAIDHLVTDGNNRAIVQSCGNYFAGQTHSGGTLISDQELVLEWLIAERDRTPNEMEIWYESSDDIAVSLISPDGDHLLQEKTVGKSKIQDLDGIEVGRYYHRKNEPNTSLSQIMIILDENADHGSWKIILKGKTIVSGRFEAWIERDVFGKDNQSQFPAYQMNSRMTTGSICNGQYSIAVGAFDGQENKMGFFSSAGPTWDGRQVPYLAAPGVGILAAKSASPLQSCAQGALTYKTGTSMAAPHVTGVIALLYQGASGPLSIEMVKAKLSAACVKPVTENGLGSNRYGHGLLNPQKLLAPYFRGNQPNITPEKGIKMDDPKPAFSTIESVLDAFHEQYPELQEGNIAAVFESLPFERELDLQPGDLVIRRFHAHHNPGWYGVVESFDQGEALVHTTKGRKKLAPAKAGWELKRLRPKPQEKKLELPADTDLSDIPDEQDADASAAEDFDAAKVSFALNGIINIGDNQGISPTSVKIYLTSADEDAVNQAHLLEFRENGKNTIIKELVLAQSVMDFQLSIPANQTNNNKQGFKGYLVVKTTWEHPVTQTTGKTFHVAARLPLQLEENSPIPTKVIMLTPYSGNKYCWTKVNLLDADTKDTVKGSIEYVTLPKGSMANRKSDIYYRILGLTVYQDSTGFYDYGVPINFPILIKGHSFPSHNYFSRGDYFIFTKADRDSYPKRIDLQIIKLKSGLLAGKILVVDPGHGVNYELAKQFRVYEWYVAHQISKILEERWIALGGTVKRVPSARFWVEDSFKIKVIDEELNLLHVKVGDTFKGRQTVGNIRMILRIKKTDGGSAFHYEVADNTVTLKELGHYIGYEDQRAQFPSAYPGLFKMLEKRIVPTKDYVLVPGSATWVPAKEAYYATFMNTSSVAVNQEQKELSLKKGDAILLTSESVKALARNSAKNSWDHEMGDGPEYKQAVTAIAGEKERLLSYAADQVIAERRSLAPTPRCHFIEDCFNDPTGKADFAVTIHLNADKGTVINGLNVLIPQHKNYEHAPRSRTGKRFFKYLDPLGSGMHGAGLAAEAEAASDLVNWLSLQTKDYAYLEIDFMDSPEASAPGGIRYGRMLDKDLFIKPAADQILTTIVEHLLAPQPDSELDKVSFGLPADPPTSTSDARVTGTEDYAEDAGAAEF